MSHYYPTSNMSANNYQSHPIKRSGSSIVDIIIPPPPQKKQKNNNRKQPKSVDLQNGKKQKACEMCTYCDKKKRRFVCCSDYECHNELFFDWITLKHANNPEMRFATIWIFGVVFPWL